MNLEPKTITPEQHKLLKESAGEMESLKAMMDMFQSQFQDRYNRAQQKARFAWESIKKSSPGLDLESIVYMPHETECKIVPVHINLSGKNYGA